MFDDVIDDDTPADADVTDTALRAQDAAETIGDDPVDDQPARPQPGARTAGWWTRRLAVTGGALIFAAAIASAAYLGWKVQQENSVTANGREALATAQSYAVILTSIDKGNVDENFAQVLDGATGDFKDMYSQSSTELRQLLIDNEAVSHGTVIDAALKSATKDTAEVLMFVDQSISNRANPEPRIDRSRINMVLKRIDGRWLASKVDIK
ncbi:hypothetical protein [Mycolicibacterium austroafricanum]|uniref:hypothetical protein n=1 Tax=Mycolicibacterium austroafricanum TaxID=39687 RepID=UPI001F430EA4|nr:hypothetical protein [Mycolicibacterium austroafricanum]